MTTEVREELGGTWFLSRSRFDFPTWVPSVPSVLGEPVNLWETYVAAVIQFLIYFFFKDIFAVMNESPSTRDHRTAI